MKTISVRETSIVLVLNKAEARAVQAILERDGGWLSKNTKPANSALLKLNEAMGEK